MHNYERKLDYYNYDNNKYNEPLYTKNENPNTILNPYNGFIKGNMFKNLYNGYKIEPIILEANSEKNRLKIMLDAICFAKEDLNLYLDIYPNDTDMIKLFESYSNEAMNLLKEYESKFGPIFVDSKANMVTPWAWDNNPWPWEN